MTAERITGQQFFGEALESISSRGEVTRATVEELKKGLDSGTIKVIVTPTVGVWRVGTNFPPSGKGPALVFLPEGTTQARVEAQAIDIMIETLVITRGLSGPELRQMDELESALRKESFGNG